MRAQHPLSPGPGVVGSSSSRTRDPPRATVERWGRVPAPRVRRSSGPGMWAPASSDARGRGVAPSMPTRSEGHERPAAKTAPAEALRALRPSSGTAAPSNPGTHGRRSEMTVAVQSPHGCPARSPRGGRQALRPSRAARARRETGVRADAALGAPVRRLSVVGGGDASNRIAVATSRETPHGPIPHECARRCAPAGFVADRRRSHAAMEARDLGRRIRPRDAGRAGRRGARVRAMRRGTRRSVSGATSRCDWRCRTLTTTREICPCPTMSFSRTAPSTSASAAGVGDSVHIMSLSTEAAPLEYAAWGSGQACQDTRPRRVRPTVHCETLATSVALADSPSLRRRRRSPPSSATGLAAPPRGRGVARRAFFRRLRSPTRRCRYTRPATGASTPAGSSRRVSRTATPAASHAARGSMPRAATRKQRRNTPSTPGYGQTDNP